MKENPELEPEGSCDGRKTTKGAIPVSDQMKVGQIPCTEPDCFVIDMQSFSYGPNKDANQTPRIKRSFSRKRSQRGEKKLNSNNATVGDRDRDPLLVASSPSLPTSVDHALGGTSTAEKAVAAPGSTDHSGSHKAHHQIAITAAAESRFGLRRNSFKRPPPPWLLDPKRILFFFATLSSIGTILLIIFTLTTSKMNGDEDSPHDPQT